MNGSLRVWNVIYPNSWRQFPFLLLDETKVHEVLWIFPIGTVFVLDKPTRFLSFVGARLCPTQETSESRLDPPS